PSGSARPWRRCCAPSWSRARSSWPGPTGSCRGGSRGGSPGSSRGGGGIRRGGGARAAACPGLLGRVGTAVVAGPGETDAALDGLGVLPFEKADIGVKVACPPAELPAVLADLAPGPLAWAGPVSAHAGTGVLWMASDAREGELEADRGQMVPALAEGVAEARERLAACGGSLVVVKAPPEPKRAGDAWGPAAAPLRR